MEVGHVIVNVGLGDCQVGGANVGDEVAKGNCAEALGGIVEGHVVDVVNRHCKLVACDGCHNQVCVPCLAFGKVGSSSRFTCRCSCRWIDGIVGGSGGWDDENGAVALPVEHRVLEEAKVSFSVSLRARNGHEIGGEFRLENAEVFVGRICARMDSTETVLDMSHGGALGGVNTKGRSSFGENNYGKDTDEDTPTNTKYIGCTNTKYIGCSGDDGGDTCKSTNCNDSLGSGFSSKFELDFHGRCPRM